MKQAAKSEVTPNEDLLGLSILLVQSLSADAKWIFPAAILYSGYSCTAYTAPKWHVECFHWRVGHKSEQLTAEEREMREDSFLSQSSILLILRMLACEFGKQIKTHEATNTLTRLVLECLFNT